MVSSRVVLDLILYELESRKSDAVKRQVIGTACVRHRQRRCTEIGKRSEPGFEVRTDRSISLHVHAAYFSGPVIEIVVRRKLVVIRGLHKLSGHAVLTTLALSE